MNPVGAGQVVCYAWLCSKSVTLNTFPASVHSGCARAWKVPNDSMDNTAHVEVCCRPWDQRFISSLSQSAATSNFNSREHIHDPLHTQCVGMMDMYPEADILLEINTAATVTVLLLH